MWLPNERKLKGKRKKKNDKWYDYYNQGLHGKLEGDSGLPIG